MTTTLAQTAKTHDIQMSTDGTLKMASGIASYADIIADEIRTLLGEIQLDETCGIDYFGTIYDSVSKMDLWKHQVTKAVTALPFVTAVESFDASWSVETKNLKYRLTVATDLGSATVAS